MPPQGGVGFGQQQPQPQQQPAPKRLDPDQMPSAVSIPGYSLDSMQHAALELNFRDIYPVNVYFNFSHFLSEKITHRE